MISGVKVITWSSLLFTRRASPRRSSVPSQLTRIAPEHRVLLSRTEVVESAFLRPSSMRGTSGGSRHIACAVVMLQADSVDTIEAGRVRFVRRC